MVGTKFLGRAIVAAVALAVTGPPAQAQITHACGGDAYYSCLTVGVTGQNTNSLTFTFTNTSPSSTSMFKLFGLSSASVVPTGISVGTSGFESACSVGSFCTNTGSTWANTFNGTGFTGDFFGLVATHPGTSPKNSTDLAQNSSATFTLTFANAADATSFLSRGNIDYALFDQGGNGVCSQSNKADFYVDAQGVTHGNLPPNGSCGVVTATPEPSSMALLGTGLFGLVPMIRRKTRK